MATVINARVYLKRKCFKIRNPFCLRLFFTKAQKLSKVLTKYIYLNNLKGRKNLRYLTINKARSAVNKVELVREIYLSEPTKIFSSVLLHHFNNKNYTYSVTQKALLTYKKINF